MATEYIEYLTVESDRWDLVAWRMYGDALGYGRIVEANPQAPLTPLLPAGLTLMVPVLVDPLPVPYDRLPPWKR